MSKVGTLEELAGVVRSGTSVSFGGFAHSLTPMAFVAIRAGYSRIRAFTLNLLAGLGGILGAVAMIFATDALPHALPYVLSFAAGNFLYVAMADLIPDLHHGGLEGGPIRQLLLIGAGIFTISLL